MKDRFLAIVNPAAGGGRSAKLAGPALAGLREKGLKIDVVASTSPGHGIALSREAYDQGYRQFIAVGGDGTAHEIVNGVFGRASGSERITLGFLPLGTGNSFLRDFTKEGAQASLQAILDKRTRPIDLLRLTHSKGDLYSFNLLSLGFTADVAAITNRYFKPFGYLGYLLGVFVRVVQLKRREFRLRCDEDKNWDESRCLFLTFNNSKFTGGTMLIAPDATVNDGLIEYVRWGPIGRMGLLRNLPTLYDGTHVRHPMAERRAARRIDFFLDHLVDVMVDGEALTLHCETLDVLPSALRVVV